MDLERFNFPTAGFAMTSLVAQVISQYRCAVSSDIFDGDTRKFQRAKDDPEQCSRRNLPERCDNGSYFRANLSSSRQN